MACLEVPTTLLLGRDGTYAQFEDALLSQDLDLEEIQRFYLQRKSELQVTGQSVTARKPLGSFKRLYENYGAPDPWKGVVGDIFLCERERPSDDMRDDADSDAEYDTDVDDQVVGFVGYADSEYIYRSACKRLHVVPCSLVTGHLTDRTLRLEHRALTTDEVHALALALVYNNSLSTLCLSDNSVGPEGIRHLTVALRHHANITHLDLSNNNLGSTGARYICHFLRSSRTLKSLSAAGNRFGDNDAKYFAEALQVSSSLRVVDLSHNEFREAGGKFIGNMLRKCPPLEVLTLSWNHLRLKGAVWVADGLQTNTSLLTLNLAWNGFANDGAQALASALKVNLTLHDLDLSCNRINLEGAVSLAEALKRNSSLASLKLSRNPITTAGACRLLTVLRTSEVSVLHTLELLGIEVNPHFERLLEEVQSLRKLRVIHGGHVAHADPYAKRKKKEGTFLGDPLTLMMEFVKKSGLRLFDFFAQLDKDNSMSVTKAEFKRGMKLVKVPLNDHQIDKLIDQLDSDRDGEISFSEFLEGQKRYRERERKKAASSAPSRPRSARSPDRTSQPMSRAKSPMLTSMTGALGGLLAIPSPQELYSLQIQTESEQRRQSTAPHLTPDVLTITHPLPTLTKSITR